MEQKLGILYLAASPIGNLADISERFKSTLKQVDIIAAEDTRRLRYLLQRIHVVSPAKILSYYDVNEKTRTPELISALKQGKTVLLISDAGTPLVNDPGWILVNAAIANEIKIECLPGPSAVLTALTVSGLPMHRFCFEGFAPRKKNELEKWLINLQSEPRTWICFESPKRIFNFLKIAQKILGNNRNMVICRELTKVHQEIIRGNIAELMSWASVPIKGELTIVVAGALTPTLDMIAALKAVKELVKNGVKLKVACNQISSASKISARELYNGFLNSRKE